VTFDSFLLIILAAVIQASWNFVAKRSSANRAILIYLGWFMFGLLALPVACFFTDFSNFNVKWVYFILGSSVVHIAYVALLGWGYSKGDFSMVYPISRGIGIVGTTSIVIAMSVHVAPEGIVGIACIVAGTGLIGLRESLRKESRQAFLIAILIGITVATYSLIDSLAVKTVPPIFYAAAINLFPSAFVAPILLTRYQTELKTVWKLHKRESFFVATAGATSYLLVLFAFQKTPAAYVIALRECSVVIAAGLGVFILKEKLYKRKVIAILLIVTGMIVIKLAH
jgi:drug/metabolite transporter (DMT)-like permease